MLKRTVPIAIILILFLTHTNTMIMRNNALMTKMVSQFQGKDKTNENTSLEPKTETQNVVSMMQNVLCRNFPSIPCDVIMKDPTLRSLIEKSVQQIKYKKMKMKEKTTLSPNYQLTLFPVINSEDLSNFLQVSDTTFYNHKNKDKPKKKAKKSVTSKNFWSHEAQPKKKESKTEFSSRKKIRKFYPHKIKYKDKNTKKDFGDYSEEKLSMSVEVPESHTGVKRRHFSYRNEPSDPPVWRIDYMKHGEPSFNMFGYETDSLRGKIIKAGPNVIVDENVLEQAARRDVLHPDVYIKKNYNLADLSGTHIVIYQFLLTMSRPVLSSHILDTSTGKPASGVRVELYKKESSWTLWHNTATNADGRILFPFAKDSMAAGTYKLVFKVEDYYRTLNTDTLYPYVEIVFNTKEGEHYHIPLLLSPYGYSTYRGS